MNDINWNKKIWSGVFTSFADAAGNKGFLNSVTWLDKQVVQATKAFEKLKSTNVISSLAVTCEYVLPAVAASMIDKTNKTLRILDFGGGLASSYLPLIAMLPVDVNLDFVVIENKEICDAGNKLFESDHRISFLTDLPSNKSFNIVHAGSSMHYIDDWYSLLEIFSELKPDKLIFADLPAGDIDSFVTTQYYYGRKIPVRFWNINEFIEKVEKLGFRMVMKSRYSSNYLEALKDFDLKHRLNYFSQIVFSQK